MRSYGNYLLGVPTTSARAAGAVSDPTHVVLQFRPNVKHPTYPYKRVKSAVNVSRLLAWCGNHLDRGGADLALLLA
jgi:hypothetical protein